MRIVRIADLSEEERKKALEKQQERYKSNLAAKEAEVQRVNKLFEEESKKQVVLPTANKQNKNIWTDLKGTAGNFTRSLGNLGINAYENVNRINQESLNERNNLITNTNNKYITKALQDKDYTEQQAQEMVNNAPTLKSIADNSKVLNNITKNVNKVILPMENKFKEWENINNEKIQENINNASNSISKKILEVTPSIAQSSVNLIPGGNVLFSAGITQNYYEDAKQQKGMTDEEASKYASIMATLESGTEMIGARLTKNVGKSLMKGNIKSALANYGLDIGENFLEEAVMEPLGELTTTVVAGKEKANWENIGQRSFQAGIDGAITSVLMGGASAGVGSAVNVVNKISNNQKVTQEEIKIAVKDTQNSGKVDVENIVKNEINNTINLQQDTINNNNNLQTQQTNQVQNKIAQNGLSEQVKIDTENFAKQVEAVKNGTFPQRDMLVLGKTPQVLKDIGLPDLPITMTQKHLDTIMNESGKYKNANYHGLGEDIIKQLPEAINNPLDIVKSNTKDDSIVLTTYLADKNDNTIVASIKIDGKGTVSDVRIDTNVMTSAYGKDNYDNFMKRNMENGNLLYDIDRGVIKKLTGQGSNYLDASVNEITGARLQLSRTSNSNITNSITPSKENVKPTNYYMQNTQNNTPKTIQEVGAPIKKSETQNISYNLPIDENTKARKHYKSILQSQYTTDEARAISKELMGTDTYEPESNNKQLERADERISLSGADNELSSLMSRAMTGGNIKADDIAVGERLIQYYSKSGDKAKLQEAIQATAMAGTTAGQTVQAMSLLNHQTPQGQAVWLQRSVDKMNNKLVKRKNGKIIKNDNGKIEKIVDNKGKDITQKVEIFNLTSEMVDTIVNSKNNKQLQQNLDKVYKELGQQVTKTTAQKIDAWRYFAMLANPRTHIRNIIGNTAMGLTQSAKNKIAGGIEGIVNKFNPNMERTHTLALVDKETKDFAKNDIKEVADRLGLNENKYNPKTRLENNMRTFKSDVFEKTIGKAFEINNKALEVEDGVGLKFAYVKALSEYMTANKLTPENITDKQLAKARNYAVEQAQEATFHQNSSLSTLINQLSNKNKFSKFMTDSILPFKKTPINVAKSGIEYSPIGLVKSAVYDSVQLRKGNITINKYIDNISKGLTGSGIALVGYALARAGILKASGSDDKDKENFDQDRGSQTYSIQIGENTYSLDWIAPSGIPLFVGAECYEIMQREKKEKSSSSDEESTYSQALETATNILDAFTNAMNPMTEMSMLSGLSSALKSYEQGASQVLASFGTNAVKSYVNQFIPTALGQVAKTTDEYERSTTSTKTGTLPKAIDSTKNYAMSKIPGLRQMLPIKTDIWGNELKQSDNVILRGLENAVFPWTRKKLNSTDVDKELINVYENTGESSVLPDLINKNLTIDKEKYVMTSEEYAKYKNIYGETSYSLLNNLIKSNNYKNMNDAQKQYAIEKVYEYAKEQIKVDYAKNNNLKYEESKLSKTVDKMKKSNGNISNYFEYLSLTQGMNKTSEKINILTDSNYTNQTKQLIYENNLLEEGDLKYDIIKTVNNFNIESYLEYKLASSNEEFKADRKDDGTLSGKTISGSAKNKKFNYISNMKNTPYMQKLIMFGLENTPSSNDKAKIVNYITTVSGKTNKEKLEMLDEFSWITIYKDSSYKY